jgi:hypothetical protein
MKMNFTVNQATTIKNIFQRLQVYLLIPISFLISMSRKPYYGIGPYLSIGYSGFEGYSNNSSTGYRKNKFVEAGIGGLLGLEWFFHQNFSLFTEYALQGGYLYSSSLESGEDEHGLKQAKLFSNKAILGISIYL